MRANVGNETNELLFGSPGTMLVAQAMLAATGEERWADAWLASADELWSRWEPEGLWTQQLYGDVVQYVGPGHGFAGNVLALSLDGGLLGAAPRRAGVAGGRDGNRRSRPGRTVSRTGRRSWAIRWSNAA